MIAAMETGREISEQMQRLYAAAKALRGVEGKSAVAMLMNQSPQTLNNWESGRPISSEGLLSAQQTIGCDAIWLRDGTGEMVRGSPPEGSQLSDGVRLLTLYEKATARGKKRIMESAESAEKIQVRTTASAND